MKPLPLFLALLALCSCINSLICLYIDSSTANSINSAFSYLLLADIIIRLIGQGPQNYFNGQWNTLDFSLIMLSLIFNCLSSSSTYSSLFKVFRVYRIFPLLKEVLQNQCLWIEFDLLEKFKKLLGTVLIILPLIARFFPLFIVVYYILGVLGLQIFYDISRDTPSETYSAYDEFSHFKEFLNTQFYLVQVLTEAGWSSVAFDYADRAKSNYGLILLFFVMCHVVIVLVLASVLKGIIWFVYITVTQLLEQEDRSEKNARAKKEDMKNKVQQFNDLQAGLKGPTLFKYDTVMKRTLFQLKADSQILTQLSSHNKKSKISLKKTKSMNLRLYRQFQSDQQLIRNQIEGKRQFESSQNNFLFTMLNGFQNTSSNVKLSDLQQVQQEDFDEHLKKLVNQFKINTTRFEYQLSSDPLLLKHLTEKLIAPYLIEKEGDGGLGLEQFTDRRTLEFHVFTLHLLLDIRTDRREQKTLIVETLAQEGVIDECDGRQLLSQPVTEQAFRVDEDCIIRQMYLEDTNKNLIDKFEAEYFSDIFGPSFKETNKITIEPLIRLEATLTYAIKKLMRYPQISSLQFFKILSEIQTKIGSQLLKKGSLFKFVFQLSAQKDTWFTVHYTALNETRLSFLKHGVWLYHPNLEENEIYYAKDIFCTGKNLEKQDLLLKATLMKKLFETFESLALTQGSSADFFDSNPSYHQYDAYLTHIDVSSLERLLPRELQINKIMAVMLTKEQEREIPLDYPISDIEAKPPVDEIDFQLDETESDTFRKLSNLCALNEQEITANEGLPFAYVLNFLCQISDILKLYAPNFVHQAQAVLEQEIRRIDSQGIKEPVIDHVVEQVL